MSLSMNRNDLGLGHDTPVAPPAGDAEPLPVEPIVSATAVRFCKTCGQPWDPAWTDCPRCARQRGGDAVIEQAHADFKLDIKRVKSAMALYFALLAVSIVSIIVVAARGEGGSEEVVLMGASAAMSVIALAWCIGSRREIMPLLTRVPSPAWLAIGALAAVPTMLVAHFAVTVLHRVLGVHEIGYLDGFFNQGWGWPAAVITICVQPAIFEELAFRGVILSALEPVIGVTQAIVVSALMFAILHLSVPSIPHLFVMGLVLAWLRQMTGSLYAGMITHFTHNLLVLLAEQHGSILPW